ncbi:MAG: hypothetical protein IJK89_03885 [Clostridia bacterium]|nr:hypothetical protein [Clostridia bacterium]
MKKTLSVILAMLLIACTLLPAFAEGGTFNVTFRAPSAEMEPDEAGTPAYTYYRSVNGEFAEFVEDPDGGYGFYSEDQHFYYIDDLTDRSRKVFDEAEPGSPESVRYSPAQCVDGPVEAGSAVAFKVFTNDVYDADTVIVMCNGRIVEKNEYDEYSVIADRDLSFSVLERDANNVSVLLKNHFTVTLTSGDGYAAKPLKYQNNKVVEYGGEYTFRVKITKGFNGDNMKVKVIRGASFLAEYLGEEADTLSSVMGDAEPLSSIGVDEDGYRMYKIKNITSDCKVLISGVNKDSSSGVLATLKRILRLILGLLGINLDSLLGEDNNPLAAYTVTLDASAIDLTSVSYKTTPEFKYNAETGNYEVEVLNGECITIVVTKTREDKNVSVQWTPNNSDEAYSVNWQSFVSLGDQKTSWSAVWYVDGIAADTAITITSD